MIAKIKQSLKGSSTHRWNLLFVALAAFETNIGLLQAILPPKVYAIIKLVFVVAYPLVMVWKRETTIGPVRDA